MNIQSKLKFLIIILLSIITSSCSTFILKKINTKSLNKEWQVIPFYPNIAQYKLGFFISNNKIPNLYLKISNFRTEFGELWMWWIPPIPLVSYSNNYNNCLNNFYIEFEILNNERAEIFLQTNKIMFDTSKIFIIKNNKRYKINLTPLAVETIIDPLYNERKNNWNTNFNMNVSNDLINRINRKEDTIISIGKEFSSPIGCQALEGATLVIGGIYLNGEELPPIEIELSYKKDKK